MKNKKQSVYTWKAISVATFFGGPITAGFLIGKNFKTFGKKDESKNSIFLGALIQILLFGAIYFTPDAYWGKLYYVILPAIYTVLAALLVKRLQGKQIEETLKKKGTVASLPHIAGYTLIGILLNGIFIAQLIFGTSDSGFENKIQMEDKVLLYYNEKMDKANSQEIATAIKESRFLEGSKGADLFLGPGDDNYKLMFVLASENLLKDTGFLKSFHDFEDYMNKNLNLDKEVSVCFTSKDMTTEYALPDFQDNKSTKKKAMADLQVFFINQNINLYHTKNIDKTYLQKMQEAILELPGYFPPEEGIDIVFLDNGPDFSLKFFVLKEYWGETEITDMLKSTVEYISGKDMGKPIKLILVDNRDYSEIEL
ncbi:MAG: hypothetical protein K9H64_13120 [Bacteroidales bacterium]|nr:hypothetical protein [Bacteroidales bacterium]MCF8456590.1 hypothetical protein [Bacteroidales bacterium]